MALNSRFNYGEAPRFKRFSESRRSYEKATDMPRVSRGFSVPDLASQLGNTIRRDDANDPVHCS